MTEVFRPLYREGRALRLLDQRLLPAREAWLTLEHAAEIAMAIRDLAVRGAPAIGVAAAYGASFSMRSGGTTPPGERFETARRLLASTRPTAVNLFAALERMARRFESVRQSDPEQIERALIEEADAIATEDLEACRRIGRYGAELLQGDSLVMTHCNAGGLATAGYGTALGVIRGAIEAVKPVRVLACETRPFLQGARLTAWELIKDGIDTTVITDNMAASMMRLGQVDLVVVGADRIAANGDVANKVGTYGVAVLAREHGLPFYVAAPLSTIDLATPDGTGIPIEERPEREVTHVGSSRLTPVGATIRNPAFDVTPAKFVTAIITERGIARPPYEHSLAALVDSPTLAGTHR